MAGSAAKQSSPTWHLDSAKGTVASAALARQQLQNDVPISAQWIQVQDAKKAQRLLDLARVYDCKAKVGVVFHGPTDKLACKPMKCASVSSTGQKAVATWNVTALTASGSPEQQGTLKSTFKAPDRQLRGVPVQWYEEDLKADITVAGFTNVEIISKGHTRKQWLVRLQKAERIRDSVLLVEVLVLAALSESPNGPQNGSACRNCGAAGEANSSGHCSCYCCSSRKTSSNRNSGAGQFLSSKGTFPKPSSWQAGGRSLVHPP